MRILLVSTFEVGALGHVILHTLRSMGHVVFKFDHVSEMINNFSKVAAVDKAFTNMCNYVEPEVILIIKGRGISPSAIKAQSARKILWWTDSAKRFSDIDDYINAVDKYYVMEEGQGHPWMPMGVDPLFHKPFHVSDVRTQSDIIFAGTAHFQRTEEVFKIFAGLANYKCAIWGNGWPHNPYQRGDAIYQLDLMAVYSGAKIILNKHYTPGITPNMRAFEAPATGTMILSDTGRGLEECYKEGKEFIAYKDERDARYLARKYIEEPEARDKIGYEGMQRANRDHLMKDRMVKMLI